MYKSYLVMKVTEVKEVMACGVSPVQCTHYVYFCGLCLLYWCTNQPTNQLARLTAQHFALSNQTLGLLDPKMGLQG